MESAQLLDNINEVAPAGVVILFLTGLVIFFMKREIRKSAERLGGDIKADIKAFLASMGGDIKTFLASTKDEVKPIVKEGFETAGNTLAVSFSDTIDKLVLPAITRSLEDASTHIKGVFSRLKPPDTAKVSPEVAADIKEFVDSSDYHGLVSHIESMSDKSMQASYYKELAKISMGRQDKSSSISAAHKYKEIEGDTPEGHWVIGYVYGWFGDTDTAIIHTEHVLKLAGALPNGSAKHMMLGKTYNALAYYYAEKGIKKEEAFTYIAKCFDEFIDSKRTAADLDTRGFVKLKFGNTEDEINSAIADFSQALEIEPDSILVMNHLQEAYKKKKDGKK